MFEQFQKSFTDILRIVFGETDLSVFSSTQIFVDIMLVTLIIYLILRSIEKIHASQVIISTLFLALLLFLSQSFDLIASKKILQWIFILVLISIPIMFQHEIRQLFERIGQSPFLIFRRENIFQRHRTIKSIKQVSGILKEKRHGALIVIEKTIPLQVYAETGVLLYAEVTKELILNIFFPKSPLHDGAIIIKGNKIISAGSVLPFTHSSSDYIFGTRHKSALGLSEVTDAIIIVISEERGEISIARRGKLISNIDLKKLEKYLEKEV